MTLSRSSKIATIPFLVLCLGLVFGARVVSDEDPAESMVSDKGVGDSEIIRILSEVRKKYNIPAMAAALVTSRGLQKAGAVGTRKWGTDVPVTLDDMWHLGSDTKIMTSVLVAILVEQGKLKWTATVSDVFPEFAGGFHQDFRKVTVLQLLSHRAGLPANLDDYWSMRSLGPVRTQRIEAVKKGFRGNPQSAPGTQYLYSNLGYIIAGAMIEKTMDMEWEAAVTRSIFTPLKMTSAGFGGLGTEGRMDQPWGHTAPKKPVDSSGPLWDNPPVLGPAGRVHCTIQDWALFVADQLRGARGESALLQPEAYAMLQNTHFGGEYALGWAVVEREWAGGKALTHAGSNTMYYAVAWLAPEKNFAVLVCTNEGQDSFKAADEAVGRMILLFGKR